MTEDNLLVEYRENLSNAREKNDPAELGLTLENLAILEVKNDNQEEGLEMIREAIGLAEQQGDLPAKFRRINIQGTIFSEINRYKNAAASFDQSLALAEQEDNDGWRSDSLANLGVVQAQETDFQKALKNLEKAVDIAENLEDLQRAFRFLGSIGNILISLADIDGALEAYNRALAYARDEKDDRSTAGFLYNLGVIYDDQDMFKLANQTLGESLDIAKTADDRELQIKCLDRLVNINLKNEDSKQVEKYLDLAKDLKIDNSRINKMRELLIYIALDKGEYQKVISASKSLLKDGTVQGKSSTSMTLWGYIGDAQYGLNLFENAEDAYNKALKFAEDIDSDLKQAVFLSRLGAVAADLDDLEKSNQYLEKGLMAGEKQQGSAMLGEINYLLALNHKELDDFEKSKEYCEKARELFDEQGKELQLQQTLELLEMIKS